MDKIKVKYHNPICTIEKIRVWRLDRFKKCRDDRNSRR